MWKDDKSQGLSGTLDPCELGRAAGEGFPIELLCRYKAGEAKYRGTCSQPYIGALGSGNEVTTR